MGDRYQSLVSSGLGKQLASRVGLPQPAILRRYRPGAPLAPGPVLLGAAVGAPSGLVASALDATGVERAAADSDERLTAVVLDATGISSVGDLDGVYAFLGGRTGPLRRLRSSGRVIVIGVAPDGFDAVADTARQALDGIVRSLGKELRAGSTANLLYLHETPGAGQGSAAVESALRFLLSGRSAYVDGQPLVIGPTPAPAPADWDKPLAGKVAVVTGAARGIGAAIAEVLARDGAHVVAADLPAAGAGLTKVANRIGGTTLQLDIAAPDAPATLLDYVTARHGGLDVLIHNAGITRDRLLANMDQKQWDQVLSVNLDAQVRVNAALLEDAAALRPGGRIVCLSSTTGLSGNRGQTNYAAAKAGIIGMVRAMAPAFVEREATINAVAPGFIDTDMTAHMPFATREVARRLNSLQQAGLPVDVAEGVAFLASPGAGGITGQVLRVCGQNLVGA